MFLSDLDIYTQQKRKVLEMKDFWEYLIKNRVLITVFQIFLCSIIYCFRENMYITPQTIAYINLIAACVLVLLFYQASRKNHIRWSYILCVASALFIFNRLYDKAAFIAIFHFEQTYFFIASGVISVLVVVYPYLKRFVKAFIAVLSKSLGSWANEQTKQDEQHQQKAEERQRKAEQKRTAQQPRDKFSPSSGTSNPAVDAEMLENTFEGTAEGAESQGKSDDKSQRQVENNNDLLTSQPANLSSVVITLLSLLAIMGVLLVPVLFNKGSDFVARITSENLLTVVLSLAATIMLLMFLSGLIVSLVAKWIQIVIDIKNNRSKGGVYFLYACGLFLVSQYIYTHYSPTLDDSANLFLDGKLFTFPLVLSILFPLFLIFTENLVTLFSSIAKKEESILGNCTNHTVEIVKNILNSLFIFIEFVTSDFLSTIIELAEEDDEIFYDDDAP